MVYKNCYKWSRNYSRLKSMLDDMFEVICRLDCEVSSSGNTHKDTCYCRKHIDGNSYAYMFAVHGSDFSITEKDLYSENAFADICSKWNVEFFDNPYYTE